MDCEEFLRQFREALDGKVPEGVIRDNVNYYRSYIGSQTAGGRSEEDVLKTLGDPRLLAKTIEESSRFASGMGGQPESGQSEERGESGSLRLTGLFRTIVIVAAVLLVIVIVFRAFLFLTPFILMFMAVSFLIKAVTGRRDR